MSAEYLSICDWLNGHQHGSLKDFDQAMAIIESYMPERASRMRTLRSDARIYELFVERLDELDRADTIQTDTITDTIVVTQPDIMPVITVDNKSQLIQSLESENRLLLKNQGHLHSQLVAIGRDRLGRSIHLSAAAKAKRKVLRDDIVAMEERIRINWHAIQHVQIHGKLPDQPSATPATGQPPAAVDWHEMENNRKNIVYLKKQISEKKKQLKGLAPDKLIKLNKQLDKLEANLAARTKKHEQWQALKSKS